jgi:hypothetical protein
LTALGNPIMGDASRNVGAGIERGESVKDNGFVEGSLARAEDVGGASEDTDEIFFRLRAEDDAPCCAGHW